MPANIFDLYGKTSTDISVSTPVTQDNLETDAKAPTHEVSIVDTESEMKSITDPYDPCLTSMKSSDLVKKKNKDVFIANEDNATEEATNTNTNERDMKRLKHFDSFNSPILTSSISHHVRPPTTCGKYIFVIEAKGGTDKDPRSGHRRDSVPISKAVASSKRFGTAILSFLEEECEMHAHYKQDGFGDDLEFSNEDFEANRRINDALRELIFHNACGLIVRINPGTLTPFTQSKLDAMFCEFCGAGIHVMPHPEVQRKMGAKDSLCKIKHLVFGMEDTDVFYDSLSFTNGFLKSIAFRPRVVKQNRGSQGEGIWICKLKSGKYCDKYGDKVVGLDEELILMEANDNHIEYHTAGEFIEFCINGRTKKSGKWDSTGTGRYLEGGIDAGAMLVDQRFLPRVVEGEVRCLMIGQKLVSVIHKKPVEGGYSATLQSGAVYTTYKPDAPQFRSLVHSFQSNISNLATAFGMTKQQLPLLWTADFMYGDVDDHGKDTFYVGEFNCACVGITQQLSFAELVGKTAVDLCVSNR